MPGDNTLKIFSAMKNDITLISDAFVESVNSVIITIDVSAGSSMDIFPAGYNPWRRALILRTKAPAVQGKANKAIISLIAETLQIKETSLSLISGHTSSLKRISVSGFNQDELIHIIEEHLSSK